MHFVYAMFLKVPFIMPVTVMLSGPIQFFRLVKLRMLLIAIPANSAASEQL